MMDTAIDPKRYVDPNIFKESCSFGGWLIYLFVYIDIWFWSEYLILKESGSCGGGAQSSEKGLQESDVGDDSSDEELYEVWAWAWATSLSCFAERICLILHICGFFGQGLWNTPKFYRNHATPEQSCLVVPLYQYNFFLLYLQIYFCCISKYLFESSPNFQAESSDEEDEEDEAPTRCIFFFSSSFSSLTKTNIASSKKSAIFPFLNIVSSGVPNHNFLICLIFRHRLEWDNDL